MSIAWVVIGCGDSAHVTPARSNPTESSAVRVVYLTESRPDSSRLKIVDYENGQPTEKLNDGPFSYLSFEVTRDGTWVAFNAYPSFPSSGQKLFLIRALGLNLDKSSVPVLGRDFAPVTWSSDGRQLMLYGTLPDKIAGGNAMIRVEDDVTLDTDGLFLYDVFSDRMTLFFQNARRLTAWETVLYKLSHPEWSPDGKRLAAFRWKRVDSYNSTSVRTDLILLDLETRKVTSPTGVLDLPLSRGNFPLVWSADGSFVVVEYGGKVYRTSPDGNALWRLTDPEGVTDARPQITPDGEYVSVLSDPGPLCRLNLISLTLRSRDVINLERDPQSCSVLFYEWVSNDEVVFVSQKMGGEPLGMEVKIHNVTTGTSSTIASEPGAAITAMRAITIQSVQSGDTLLISRK